MKKLALLLGILFTVSQFNIAKAQDKPSSEDAAISQMLRFHVIANSDREEDQNIKLKIRDAVLRKMSIRLNEAKTLSEARAISVSSLKEIELTAEKELQKAGFKYGAKAEFGSFEFPTKSYGNFVLPAGKYEAVRIKLGKASGKNWWCVLFPPLCFIDITQSLATNPGMLANTALDQARKHGVTKTENQTPVAIRFKTLELLRNLFN